MMSASSNGDMLVPLNLEGGLESAMPEVSSPMLGRKNTRLAGAPVGEVLTQNPWEKMKFARTGQGHHSPLLGEGAGREDVHSAYVRMTENEDDEIDEDDEEELISAQELVTMAVMTTLLQQQLAPVTSAVAGLRNECAEMKEALRARLAHVEERFNLNDVRVNKLERLCTFLEQTALPALDSMEANIRACIHEYMTNQGR
ncbi:unnamed protein product [Prorocentrum cordatum]|nr:unnamed protein product [Polarella glacialis]